MSQTAAHRVEHVIAHVPVRQWVLSLPIALRVLLAARPEPLKYYLSNLPEDTALDELVRCAHMRWRIERDYQELKQELGLGHYEGRGWRGFHHHAVLSIAAYGFLVSERLRTDKTTGSKKTPSFAKCLRFPAIASHVAALRAQRHVADSIATIRHELSFRLIESLGRCPCCGRARAPLRL